MKHDGAYSYKEIKHAMKNPIQLHYASTEKPWKYVDCVKSEIWFEYIVKTEFLREYLELLPKIIVLPNNTIQNTNISVNEDNSSKKSNYLKKGMRYIKNNPLFLFKPYFYKRLFKVIFKRGN